MIPTPSPTIVKQAMIAAIGVATKNKQAQPERKPEAACSHLQRPLKNAGAMTNKQNSEHQRRAPGQESAASKSRAKHNSARGLLRARISTGLASLAPEATSGCAPAAIPDLSLNLGIRADSQPLPANQALPPERPIHIDVSASASRSPPRARPTEYPPNPASSFRPRAPSHPCQLRGPRP